MTDKELASSELPAITTRFAMREDLAEVLEMYIKALNEIQDYIEPISAKKCAEFVLACWVKAPCILLEKAGKIIGFAGMKSEVPSYTDSVIMSEYMFYIKPEHRSMKAAKVMSDAAKKAAKECGVPLYMSHMVFEHDVATKAKFLKRWGYKIMTIGVKWA